MPYPTAAPAADRPSTSPHLELRNRLDSLARAHRVPGAQLAVHTGTHLLSVHTGTADALTGSPFTAETAVPLGSVTKVATAAALLLLADDGDLDLDEPVVELLPVFSDVPEVTVRHLLSHTAGLPTGPDSDSAAGATVSRYLSAVCTARNALFPPGSGFSYSNAGYVAAGRVLSEVTGMTWQEALGAMLLEPLGIVPAFLGDTTSARPVATGHALNTATGLVRPAHQNLAPVEAPAGALLASAEDLVALGRAVVGRSAVLPATVADLMRRPEPAADPGALADSWGLGLALFRQDGRMWCGHDGNAQGTSCHLRADPDSGVVVAFTGNAGAATALWRDLTAELARLTGIRVPATPAADVHRGPAVPLPDCAGTYRNGSTEYAVKLDGDGKPTLSVDGDYPIPLLCHADLSYDLVDPATGRVEPGGRFHRDPATGAIDRLQISGRTARRTGSV
ncbi:serine hydrolase domain-containing protein [Streptomyces sp.]|uniref:serine hydrolase domain-containing protein n=1 Tax=Streptomyces sp. TaxID=1931 RepID=UPI002D74219D|nr:serine hydrolase domain-containing protein [Streptomyces sp.]HZF91446.1 serine hydrolase domain-containing protein [Streptomyces sp.]